MVIKSLYNLKCLPLRELPASEEYLKMRQINYPQTDAFFILYSIDDANSLQNALNLVYNNQLFFLLILLVVF